MKTTKTKPVHEEFNRAIKAVLEQFKDKLSNMEMLAVSAHLVGVLIAVQDQRIITSAVALDSVSKNIEAGNKEAMEEIQNSAGNA